MHITVSRCSMCFDGQLCATKCEQCEKHVKVEVSKVSNTAPNLMTMFANNALLGGGVDLAADFTGLWLHLGSLSLLLSLCFCPNSSLLSSQFSVILHFSADNDKLNCIQLCVNRVFEFHS